MKKMGINEKDIVSDYVNGMDIYSLCSKYHIGKIKIKKILSENNIELRKRGGQVINKPYIVKDYKTEKYPNEEGYHYIAKYKTSDYTTNDFMNNGGHITSYIKEKEKIDIPSLYDRREYYKLTGNYWWEQYFDIVKIKNDDVKKCPYCDWETTDLENRSGAFTSHLKEKHNMDIITYIKNYPEDKYLFNYANKTLLLQQSENKDKFVTCHICGKKLKRIDNRHLSKHNTTLSEYKIKYGYKQTVATDTSKKLSAIALSTNEKHIITKDDFVGKAEKEIRKFLIKNNIKFKTNDRKTLHGQELDILIPSYKLAIEYNGLYWHTEKYGKDKNYHLNKLKKCNEMGISLIQIFEDEYENNKKIVFSKLRHLLHKEDAVCKIGARKCNIQELNFQEASSFLNENHIQGYSVATVYLGAIYKETLVGVMSFLKMNEDEWVLERFATLNGYICQGLGGKLFSYFKKHYTFKIIKSFADRRWTLNGYENFYTKLGFNLKEILPPQYRYYNAKVDKLKRFHKFGFRKQIIHKKYGFPLTMTELEMTRELGYDKIWDCGLFKYVYEA